VICVRRAGGSHLQRRFSLAADIRMKQPTTGTCNITPIRVKHIIIFEPGAQRQAIEHGAEIHKQVDEFGGKAVRSD
jgi:hypothetical protein